YYYKPRLDWELLAEHSQGLVATTGCLGGHVLQSLLQGDERAALEKAGRLQEIFGRDNLFVELQDHGLPAQRETNPKLIELATTRSRVQYELDTIAAMGFSSYFLIVWDLIKHARDANIRVGPGRGSAAGCAVAYALRITDLDPIKYDLLFERFLNPSRISMP